MIDINAFRRNQSSYPREELAKYNGCYVAWSPDGTHILAAHADASELDATLSKLGHDPAEILVSLVAVPEEVAHALSRAHSGARACWRYDRAAPDSGSSN
jgi:hypothetical protein